MNVTSVHDTPIIRALLMNVFEYDALRNFLLLLIF